MKIIKGDSIVYITVDNTHITVDSTLVDIYQAPTYSFQLVPRYTVDLVDGLEMILIREIDGELIEVVPSFKYNGNFIKVSFTTVYFDYATSNGLSNDLKMSLSIKDKSGKVVFNGKALYTLQNPQDFKYTTIINNKLYL